MAENQHTLVDPPVGPYSSAEELSAWLEELRNYEPDDNVRQAIDQAKRWLANAEKTTGTP